ncbi:DUF4184 family protein [Pelagibacteraceae bacterium]|nr:DUF4184 family protein [Pelagibacteraceae bacterium]
MPITPFHIIAGFAVKSIFNKHFSWSIFALTNIIIDLEVIYYILTIGETSHKFFHTLIGSSITALSCAIIGIPICERVLKFWNKNLQNEKSLEKLKCLSADTNISIFSSFTGAFVGAYSHILLDNLMHFDVKPFEPFFSKTFVGIISIDSLHLSLVGLSIFGLIIYLFRKFR